MWPKDCNSQVWNHLSESLENVKINKAWAVNFERDNFPSLAFNVFWRTQVLPFGKNTLFGIHHQKRKAFCQHKMLQQFC